jgi:iron(III) transport system substrate-binding protein
LAKQRPPLIANNSYLHCIRGGLHSPVRAIRRLILRPNMLNRLLTCLHRFTRLARPGGVLVALQTASAIAFAQGSAPVLNLYSARHYQTDEALYSDFTRQTGIRVNRIEAGDEALLERIRTEGAQSPADVLLLVDASRLWRAQIDGLFQPVRSKILDARIPAHLRGKDDGKGAEWYGISTRARVLVYNRAKIRPEEVRTYEDLANPSLKGKVCSRSGTSPYMLSLDWRHVGASR